MESAPRYRNLRSILAGLALVVGITTDAAGQTPTPVSAGQFWPELDVHLEQLPWHLRAILFTELKKGEDFPKQQWKIGGGLGRRWRNFSTPRLLNIDPDNDHYVVLGGGYEYITTIESETSSHENRITGQGTLGFRFPAGFRLQDRNRVELRWVDGTYSTRYRNKVSLARDCEVRNVHFTAYVSAEAFYDWADDSWNQAQYAAGVEWPYQRLWMLKTYYLRKNCSTCSPEHLNVAGLALNVYLRNSE